MKARNWDEISLTPHRNRTRSEKGVSAMEMVAWMAGEKHGDSPERACPVITEFIRDWSYHLDDSELETLRTVLPHVVDTKDSALVANQRAAMVLDWLIRKQASAWVGYIDRFGFVAQSLADCNWRTKDAKEILRVAYNFALSRVDFTQESPLLVNHFKYAMKFTDATAATAACVAAEEHTMSSIWLGDDALAVVRVAAFAAVQQDDGIASSRIVVHLQHSALELLSEMTKVRHPEPI